MKVLQLVVAIFFVVLHLLVGDNKFLEVVLKMPEKYCE
jgi:hypothetical protein